MEEKLIDRYYITTFISELARSIPHPILIILLIEQKGLTLSEITFVQIFFYLGILLFEIPSGYLADLGFRKSGYIGSFVCMVIAYGLIYQSTNLILLAVAWFIYGIASALMSGNVDGYIVNSLKTSKNEHKIKQFNVNKTNVSLIAGIGGALIGSLMYPLIKTNIYAISLGLYTVAILIAVFGMHIKRQSNKLVKLKLKDIKFTKNIKILIILICIIELYYVGFYQYWQVLYQSKGVDPVTFGLIYIIFSLTVIASNKLYSKLEIINDNITMPVFLVSAVISIFVVSGILFCIIYPITLFIANLYVIDIYTKLYQNVDEKSISSVISIASSANRFIGIIILAMLAYVLNVFDLPLILIVVYSIFALFFYLIRSEAKE